MIWSAATLHKATGGTLHGSPDWSAAGLEIDSRRVRPGDVFIALSGERNDGHDYAEAAANAGAVAMICERPLRRHCPPSWSMTVLPRSVILRRRRGTAAPPIALRSPAVSAKQAQKNWLPPRFPLMDRVTLRQGTTIIISVRHSVGADAQSCTLWCL